MESALVINHVENSAPPSFTVARLQDGKSAGPFAVKSPYDFPVEGQPNSNLMLQLGWYLEHYLDYPHHPETGHADRVLDALKAWGTQSFNALFDFRDAADWLKKAAVLQVRSNDPRILSWPWEALCDPRSSYVALQRRVERCMDEIDDPPELGTLPEDRVNILLVVARPYENDVAYRSLARPMVELIASQGLPAHVDVLRPPTFKHLREQLRAKPGYYHVLHFDGHGGYGEESAHTLSGSHGARQ